MKLEEKVAEKFLREQGYGEIIYEPKGQRTPDFSINNEIGVEVRRLNKHLLSSGKFSPIEELEFELVPKLKRLFESYSTDRHSKSSFVCVSFRRPIKASKNLIDKVKSILDRHSTKKEEFNEFDVSDYLTITIIPSDERFEHKYILGSSTDFDRSGFVLSNILDSLNIIVPEKQKIVEPYLNDFAKWWLVFVDHIGYGPSKIEMKAIQEKFHIKHPFERIYLISPIDKKIGSFI
jgi:hypothetical protein